MSDESAVRMEDLLAHRQWVRALARRLAADESRADDLEQETWLVAAEHPPRDAQSLRGWLGAVMRNLQRNARRGDYRRDRREQAVARPETTPSADDVVAEAETQHLLVREVLDLDEPYRSTVLLRWFEDLTPAQIAERQGAPIETVRTRLKRAVERLRERMDARHEGDRRAWCLLLLGRDSDGAGTGVAAGGAKAALAGAAGGVVMGMATKLAVAAAVLVAIGAGVWWTRSDVAPAAAPVQKDAASPAPAPSPKHERHAAAVETATPETTTVDLSRVDRDLDLHGTVVRADGTPVVGATVQAVDYPWLRSLGMFFTGHTEGRPGPSTKSAADGAFALRLRRATSTIVRVSADGLATRLAGAYQAGARVKLVMSPAVKLRVTVRDEAGAPVAAAGLRLIGLGGRDDEPWIDASAVTDAAGKCVFDGLPGGAQPSLAPVSGLGDFGQQRVKLPAEGETSIDVVSPTGRTIRGRAFDAATLSPVQNARVGAWPFLLGTTTDGGGRFEIRGWTGKSSRDLHALADGYARAVVAVGAGDALEIPMLPGFAATGRVLDEDGKPFAGAYVAVEASPRGGASTQMSVGYATSDAEGRFRIGELSPGLSHALSAFASGHGRVRRLVAPQRLDAGVFDVGDVRLTAPRAIEGRVLTADGAPTPNASIRLKGPDGPWSSSSPGLGDNEEHRTDDIGRFRFGDLAPGDYVVERQVPGGTPDTMNVKLTADRDVVDLVFQSKPTGGSVVVVVKDDAGAPVAEMGVGGQDESGAVVQRKTDAAGRAELAPTKGRITKVHVGGYSEGFLRVEPVDVAPGRREVAVAIERGVATTCRVLDADGAPLARAWISVEPVARSVVFSTPSADGAYTDAEGRINVTLARDGDFTFTCHGVLYDEKRRKLDSLLEAREEHVAARPDEIVLRCRRVETGRTVVVRALAADGSPLADVEVRLTCYAAVERKAKTDAEGRARFDGLPAREFQASTTFGTGLLAASPEKFVPSGQEVVLKFPAAATVTGLAALAGGGVEANVSVMVYRGEVVICMARTDRDGRFSVQVPTDDVGPFRIVVSGMKSSGEREVTARDRDVRIELKPR